MIDNLAYAAKVAPLFQAWLEQETGIPYNLPKMGKLAFSIIEQEHTSCTHFSI